MSKSKGLKITVTMRQLLDENCQKRFKVILEEQFGVVVVDDKGPAVVFHYRIIDTDDNKMDIIFYSTGSLYLSSSPKIGNDIFLALRDRVLGIAKQCVESLSKSRPVTSLRSISILDFVSELDKTVEHNRMVSVILCDTVNEIILTEIMKKEKIKGPPLEEGISKKIEYLEKKGLVIPFKSEVENIRNLRNDVVHKGTIPDVSQTEIAVLSTQKFIDAL